MNDTDFSVHYFIERVKLFFSFLIGQKISYAYVILVSVFLFTSYNYIKSPIYHAVTNFVIEDDNSSQISDLSSIASIAGINTSAFTQSTSLFQIDNIQELYVSSLMLKKTLLSEVEYNGRSEKIIDLYIRSENLENKLLKKGIKFKNSKDIDRAKDSVIQKIIKKIKKKNLIVSKPNRKTTIIEVGFNYEDEILAKFFNETLVDNVNDFYFEIMTKKSKSNVDVLQKQADSVKKITDFSIEKLAFLEQDIPNANPLLKSNKIPLQIELLNLQANKSIYAEIVKQLELAKISQRNRVPVLQIIDQPILPLPNSQWEIITTLIYGIFTGIIICTIYFSFLILIEKEKL